MIADAATAGTDPAVAAVADRVRALMRVAGLPDTFACGCGAAVRWVFPADPRGRRVRVDGYGRSHGYADCAGAAPPGDEREALRAVRGLMTLLAPTGWCRGCGRTVHWVVTRKGSRAPYDDDATSHFATCPKASAFRGGGR
jgi:hypothetical protein